jgi:hypothetical protein
MSKNVIVLMLGVLLCCGGLAQAVQTDFHSDVTIQTGDVYDTVDTWDTATVTMAGGLANVIEARNSSTFQLQSGNITGWISGCDTSDVIMSGGSVRDVQLFNSSIVNVSGGNITGSLGLFSNTAMVYIYGKNFNCTPNIGGGWTISGNWDDTSNTPFAIWYRAGYSSPQHGSADSQIHLIPEPATLLLLGFGSFLLRKSH